MKRTILAALFVGSSFAVFAQDDNAALNTSTEYNAYSAFTATAPDYVNSYVLRDYPAATEVRWRQAGEWWHGFYMENGEPMHVYYNDAGQSFRVAIPVRQSFIPENVVDVVVNEFGPVVYDVNTIKGTHGQEIYHVRLLENGQLIHQYLNADGSKAIDIWRTDVADSDLHQDMNHNMNTDVNNTMAEDVKIKREKDGDYKYKAENADGSEIKIKRDGDELKIKTETKDGKKIKTEIEDGKVKTKKDD